MRVVKFMLCLLLLLFVVAALVAWTMPAQLAWRMAASRMPSLQLEGIQGSIWKGHATQASIAGQPLGAMDWRMDFWPMLQGDLRASTRLSDGGIPATGIITRHLDGSIDVREAHVEVPAEWLQPAIGIQSLNLRGSVQVNIHHARLRNAWFEVLDADARWHDAGVSGAAEARFGDALAHVTLTDQIKVHGDIRDDGKGALWIRGDFDALPTGYTLELRLRARNPDDLRTQEALQYLGQRQADGSVLMQAGGKLLLPGMP